MSIVGHERIIKFLKRILSQSIPFHGFLFQGPEGVGKKTVAREFARGILCEKKIFGGCGKCASCKEFSLLRGNHRDFLFLEPMAGESYGIEVARSIKIFLTSRPQLGIRQVVILDEADELTAQAQNSLLKILEEPPADAVLVLIAEKPGRLFETIRSRLVKVSFRLVPEKEIFSAVKSEKIARLAFGRPGRAFRFLENLGTLAKEEKLVTLLKSLQEKPLVERFALSKELSENAKEVFPLWHLVLRERLLARRDRGDWDLNSLKILRKVFNAAITFEDTNANPRLLMENLFLQLG
ncbi:MAG: AAA family ATPase [Parcubacteria group bacterium]|nr:AAA family ATPase [Parcubacteria group bacterium]